MHTETRTTDTKGRLVLPKSFANATVIIEQTQRHGNPGAAGEGGAGG